MSDSDGRLVVGASLLAANLPEHLEWLIAGQRPLELQDAVRPEVLDGDWRTLARETRALLDGHRGPRGVHAAYDGLVLNSRDPRVQAVARDRLLQGLDFAAETGGTHLVVHSPFVSHGGPYAGLVTPELLDTVHATLDPVVAAARAAGCLIVVEVVFDLRVDPLLETVRSFAAEHVRLSLDVGHARVMQTQGGPPPDFWIGAGGALLAHVHLHDTDGVRDRHWRPGDGVMVWRPIFEELGRIARPPYHPRLILEVRPAHTIGAADWLIERGYVR